MVTNRGIADGRSDTAVAEKGGTAVAARRSGRSRGSGLEAVSRSATAKRARPIVPQQRGVRARRPAAMTAICLSRVFATASNYW